MVALVRCLCCLAVFGVAAAVCLVLLTGLTYDPDAFFDAGAYYDQNQRTKGRD